MTQLALPLPGRPILGPEVPMETEAGAIYVRKSESWYPWQRVMIQPPTPKGKPKPPMVERVLLWAPNPRPSKGPKAVETAEAEAEALTMGWGL